MINPMPQKLRDHRPIFSIASTWHQCSIFLLALFILFIINGCSYWGNAPKLEWAIGIGGFSGDWSTEIATDKQGNVIMITHINGEVDFDPGPNTNNLNSGGRENSFLASYSPSGSLNWAFEIPSNSQSRISLSVDNANNVIVIGTFVGTVDFDPSNGIKHLYAGPHWENMYVASYSSTGEFNWAFEIGEDGSDDNGSVSAVDFTLDQEGNTLIAGSFRGLQDFDPGPESHFLQDEGDSNYVANYSPAGNLNWAFNLTSPERLSIGAISTDSQDNVVITGLFEEEVDFDPDEGKHLLTAKGDSDIFVASYSSSGKLNWAFNLGVDNDDPDITFDTSIFSKDLAIDSIDNILILGEFRQSVDFNPDSEITSLTAKTSRSSGFPRNGFIASYTSDGDLNWVYGFDTFSVDAEAMAINSTDNIMVTGVFSGTVDFDSSAESSVLNASDREDIFVASYTSDGGFNWVFQAIGQANDHAYAITTDDMDNIFIAGLLESSADFDPNYWVTNLTSNGETDIFLAKYACCPE